MAMARNGPPAVGYYGTPYATGVPNITAAPATATPVKRRASIVGVIRSACLFAVVTRATGYLRQPSVHTILRGIIAL